MSSNHTVVLLSGGVDSSSTVHAMQLADADLSALFINYGQPAADSEWQAARLVSEHYRIPIRRLDLGFSLGERDGEFFGRNAAMILAAAATSLERPLAVAFGVHALASYYDTTPIFMKHMQRLLDGYSAGAVTLSAPFLRDTKADVIRYAQENGVPLHLTYSCETTNAPACGQCSSCMDRSDIDAT